MKKHLMNEMHPYERIEVIYSPPSRPDHIVEDVFIRDVGDEFRGCSHIFVDGEDSWNFDVAKTWGWKNIAKWGDETKKWRAREAFGNNERYDAMQVAILRREKMFGEGSGAYSDVTIKFEQWLMDQGWRPIMLDRLNAYSPGRVLCGERVEGSPDAVSNPTIYHTHIYAKGSSIISMQFGFGPFNFVFMHSDYNGTFQVPVDDAMFDDAVNGRLERLEAKLIEQH